APDERTGVGMRMPSRLQPENVARNMPLTELSQEVQDFLLPKLGRGTIPHAQAPHRWKAAAPGEQVVSLYGMSHAGTAKDVHVHAPCRGKIHADKLRPRFARA